MQGTFIIYTTVVYTTMKHNIFFGAIHQIIKTGHWITDSVSTELKVFGVSEPQFNVLRILRGQNKNPITVEEVANRMIQRSSNVTRIIDKLLARGFVIRKECESNRRKMDISITNEGLQFLKQLDKKVNDFHKPMFDKLTEKEALTLITLIKKLRD